MEKYLVNSFIDSLCDEMESNGWKSDVFYEAHAGDETPFASITQEAEKDERKKTRTQVADASQQVPRLLAQKDCDGCQSVSACDGSGHAFHQRR